MTAISWQSALILGAMVVKDMYGQVVDVNNSVPVHVAVWPALSSMGQRATGLGIYAPANVHMALNAAAETVGLHSARIIKETQFAFPLHPDVHTISFLDAQSSTQGVHLLWILG